MRSKASPPMGVRGAMQFRRDGAKQSSRTGAAELSEERARQGGDWETRILDFRGRFSHGSYCRCRWQPLGDAMRTIPLSRRAWLVPLLGWFSRPSHLTAWFLHCSRNNMRPFRA